MIKHDQHEVRDEWFQKVIFKKHQKLTQSYVDVQKTRQTHWNAENQYQSACLMQGVLWACS